MQPFVPQYAAPLTIDRVEWVPASPEVVYVRVLGRWAAGPRPEPLVLVVGARGKRYTFVALEDPPEGVLATFAVAIELCPRLSVDIALRVGAGEFALPAAEPAVDDERVEVEWLWREQEVTVSDLRRRLKTANQRAEELAQEVDRVRRQAVQPAGHSGAERPAPVVRTARRRLPPRVWPLLLAGAAMAFVVTRDNGWTFETGAGLPPAGREPASAQVSNPTAQRVGALGDRLARMAVRRERLAKAAARRERLAKAAAARERARQRERVAKIATRRTFIAGVEARITQDARNRVSQGLFREGPIQRTTCTPADGGTITDLAASKGTWYCMALIRTNPDGTRTGYRFTATVDYDTFAYSWRPR